MDAIAFYEFIFTHHRRRMMINYHPAFSWYSLILFAIIAFGFCWWACGKSSREQGGPTRENDDESRWWAVVTDSGVSTVTYPVGETFTAFCRRFESAAELLGVITTLPDIDFLFLDSVTVLCRSETGEYSSVAEDADGMARGDTFFLLWYPASRSVEDERLRYSEIEESGVLDRPRQLRLLVYHTTRPFTDSQGRRCQGVVLVPRENQSDQSMLPILFVADISSHPNEH